MADLLFLHLRAEALRARMHRVAEKHGLSDPRVLRLSQELDKLMVEIMRLENGKESGVEMGD